MQITTIGLDIAVDAVNLEHVLAAENVVSCWRLLPEKKIEAYPWMRGPA
jgi:hypothetical protein